MTLWLGVLWASWAFGQESPPETPNPAPTAKAQMKKSTPQPTEEELRAIENLELLRNIELMEDLDVVQYLEVLRLEEVK